MHRYLNWGKSRWNLLRIFTGGDAVVMNCKQEILQKIALYNTLFRLLKSCKVLGLAGLLLCPPLAASRRAVLAVMMATGKGEPLCCQSSLWVG
jgi:hypothetical protein